ncbi:hypothetical protein H9P43_006619 [Blastocladiella emersonii ATCC 22665]|nr:hypothetical protein H9P43_006619 [Blastocladiella emersonii ATCC 22665]
MVVADGTNNLVWLLQMWSGVPVNYLAYRIIYLIVNVPTVAVIAIAAGRRYSMILVANRKWRELLRRGVLLLSLAVLLLQWITGAMTVIELAVINDARTWVEFNQVVPNWVLIPMSLLPLITLGGSLLSLRLAFKSPRLVLHGSVADISSAIVEEPPPPRILRYAPRPLAKALSRHLAGQSNSSLNGSGSMIAGRIVAVSPQHAAATAGLTAAIAGVTAIVPGGLHSGFSWTPWRSQTTPSNGSLFSLTASKSTTTRKKEAQGLEVSLTFSFKALTLFLLAEWILYVVAMVFPPPIHASPVETFFSAIAVLTEASFEWVLKLEQARREGARRTAHAQSEYKVSVAFSMNVPVTVDLTG